MFFTIYCLMQALHFSIFKYFLQIEKIELLKEALDAKDRLDLNIGFTHFLYIVPIVSVIIYYCKKYKKEKKEKIETDKETFNKGKKIVYSCIVVLFVFGYCISNVIYNIKDTNESLLRREMIDSNGFINRYGFIDFAINDIIRNIKTKIPFVQEKANRNKLEKLDSYFEERAIEKDSSNEMSGIFKDENLIFITAESFGPYGINEELTKTLYKLKEEGIYFNNYYSPNIGTIDTEVTMLTSLIPTYNKGRVFYNYANNSSKFSMPTMFKEKGYSAMAFHNFWDKYYNRKLFMPTLGFNSYQDINELGIPPIEEGIDDFPKDIDLFRNSLPNYMKDEKFLAYYMTVSGHGAYYEDRISLLENHEIVEELYGDTLPYTTKYYLASQMHLDQGIEYLINQLEETGLIENTVIVIIGDHYPYFLRDDEIKEVFKIEDELELYKIPFIIWSKDIESKKEDRIINTVDVLPTLGNMFDLEVKYSMGVDIYNDIDSKVRWNSQRGFSFLNKDIYYDKKENKINYNENISKDYVEKLLRKNYEEYLISQWIIETNYFSNQ